MTPTNQTINQLSDKIKELEALLQQLADGCSQDHHYTTMLEAALMGELDEGDVEDIRSLILENDLTVSDKTGLDLGQITEQRVDDAQECLQALIEASEQR